MANFYNSTRLTSLKGEGVMECERDLDSYISMVWKYHLELMRQVNSIDCYARSENTNRQNIFLIYQNSRVTQNLNTEN